MSFNWQFIVWIVVVGIICGIIGYAIPPRGLTDAEVNAKIAKAVNQSVSQKNAEIETLKGLIEILENKTAEPEIIGYLIDELFLNTQSNNTLSDREISTLFDGEVEFDGEEYDLEEVVRLNVILVTNQDDYAENVYLHILRDNFDYGVLFDSSLDISKINEDETLVFNFLGNELEVSEINWSEGFIVFFQGESHVLNEGDSVTVGDQVVVLELAGDESAHVSVDGDWKEIKEGYIRTINNLQIKIEYSFETSSFRVGQAKLIISEDIENKVHGGEEYEEDSIWNWVIEENYLGIELDENFDRIDDREGYNAFASEESLCLPNDYVCVRYNGLVEEDYESYEFELDEGVIVIEGKFESELDDYDEIFLEEGIFYDDFEDRKSENKITGISLGNSEQTISFEGDVITIGDVGIEYNESAEEGSIFSFVLDGMGEDNYRTDFGTIIESPEDNLEDDRVSLLVPEEKLEGSISLV